MWTQGGGFGTSGSTPEGGLEVFLCTAVTGFGQAHNGIMNKIRISFLALLFMSASAFAQNQLPEQSYNEFAIGSTLANKCGLNGQLSPDKAAWGKLYIERELSKFSYDSTKYAAVMERLDKEEILPRQCNKVAMQIAELQLKEQRAQPPEPVAPPTVIVQPTQPWRNPSRTTSCRTTLGWTLCDTF